MRFAVTLTKQQPKIVEADSVRYEDAPGFVLFVKDDDEVIAFNASKIESIKTLPEITQ